MTHKEALSFLSDLSITVRIHMRGPLDGHPEIQSYSLANPPPEHIDCPKCSSPEGGWDLGAVMEKMVAARETAKSVTIPCKMMEDFGRNTSRRCLVPMSAQIRMSFRR